MSTPRVVLVTGVSRNLGAQLAARLANSAGIDRVIGIEGTPGGESSPDSGVELVDVEMRTPELARLLDAAEIEAVVHLAITTTADHQAGGRAAMKEQNVISTMQLLAACQRAPALRKLVVRSSTAAYGASFRDPAVFTEDTEPREIPRGGFARDVLDIEEYVRGFRRRQPQVVVTVLRFAPLIGPRADTRLTRYFALPVVPTVLGRDPRLQFVHSDDALEVLRRSVVNEHPGTFNVAGSGVLTLSKAIRRAGRIGVPILEPGLSAVAAFARSFGLVDFSLDQLDLFVHGRVVDTCRLAQEFGFEPRSTAEAFDDFVRGEGFGPLAPDAIHSAERVVRDRIRDARRAVVGG